MIKYTMSELLRIREFLKEYKECMDDNLYNLMLSDISRREVTADCEFYHHFKNQEMTT